MGISIEVHRARIGLHNNTKAKYQVSCCLEAKLKSAIKILFYVSLLYILLSFFINEIDLPCLNQLFTEIVKPDECENKIRICFTEMLCYNVYVYY